MEGFKLASYDCGTIENPKYVWQLDLFGNKSFVVNYTEEEAPSDWQRFWSAFFLGSKWTKIDD